jgi:hypothetical protein
LAELVSHALYAPKSVRCCSYSTTVGDSIEAAAMQHSRRRRSQAGALRIAARHVLGRQAGVQLVDAVAGSHHLGHPARKRLGRNQTAANENDLTDSTEM